MTSLQATGPKVFDLAADGTAALKSMTAIREFESRLPGYSREGLIRGSTHPSVGMEAIAVGVSHSLRSTDSIASNHRGHAHCLAKGADAGRTLAEILGRRDGYCGGKGGSMHIGVKELGILGTNGIVGAGIGLATGAALAAQQQDSGDVAVAYFGDGASNQGVLPKASTWPPFGSFRSSSSAKTTTSPNPQLLKKWWPSPSCADAARPMGFLRMTSTAWTSKPSQT